MEFDIFFYEVFEEEKLFLLKYLPKEISAGFTSGTIQESGHSNLLSKVISIRTQSIIPLLWFDNLDAIITRSTGYNHLLSIPKKIQIGYLPLYCNRACAEQSMLLWMSILRKLRKQISNFSSFNRDGITGLECAGKNLLVVGVGNIGKEICKIGYGLDMYVKGVDICYKHHFVEYVSMIDGIKWADIIVCSMNLTKENNGYFTEDIFRLSDKKPIFINISRGEFCSSQILLKLLKEQVISGVGLDVYNDEPLLATAMRLDTNISSKEMDAIIEMSNRDDCILTPHNAFNTQESVERKCYQTVEQLIEYFKNGEFKWNCQIQ